ncbi:hypothetical protein BBK36DRAFT_1125735 [Trichoderma citrinoviride]|uniref:DUF2293 domain-containing protein n=1 Tax=Trichoderma citrinoviride TaxID=58853 RepID=A0A2T4B394_9HYPO|nr:hypothetical protein BBK36DRAFT_1125735 [Trichoderma citrinoviride]PTB63802.1 hypothetical protein BBK36DRAFT_1125735 [Trichoderma citrinoviride]
MGRTRRALVPGAASGPKERHRRSQRAQYRDPLSPPRDRFVAKPPIPKSKHHSYFELVENKEKKKKLEYQITTESTPPPGFEFVPIGNPELTAACKELSREKDAMIFIVSNAKCSDENMLAHQMHRIGHHIRQVIVEEAKANIGDIPHRLGPVTDAGPEPIPQSQAVYHAQVDAAIRDLFPRVPNTDRQMIIEHSFTRGSNNRSENPVGFSEHLTLSRRVQLAVLAHIRHVHTRYDALLKETTWQNARKTVESLCLDILVKWRGDEETGRDQLDEILREVVVISDSEDDDDEEDEDEDEESTDFTSDEDAADHAGLTPMPEDRSAQPLHRPVDQPDRSPPRSPTRDTAPVFSCPPSVVESRHMDRCHREDRRAQRGFRRYRAWEEAIRRNRGETPLVERPSPDLAIGRAAYQPSKPNGPSYDAHVRPYDNAGPMVHPGGAPGASPSLNGHGIQRPLYEMSSPLISSPYRGQPLDARFSHEKVMSVVPFPSSTSSRELAPSASGHFQDMLVRSIEPASPSVQSTYIRTLPPRSQVAVSTYGPPVTPAAGFQPAPRLVSYSGEGIHPRDFTPVARATANSLRPQVAMDVDAISSRESVQSRDFRGPVYPQSTDYGAQPTSSPYHPVSGNPGSSSAIRLPETRRIVLNAPRPGERANPILMEDRGGYYERVNPPPERSSRIQLRASHPSQTQAQGEAQGNIRPHTAMLSWEERMRQRGERRGVAEIEIDARLDPRSRPPNAPHAPMPHPYSPRDYYGAPRYEPLDRESDYAVPPARQVPGEQYAAPPPEGYWVIRQHGDRQAARPQLDPVYHPVSTRLIGVNERYGPRRETRNFGQPAPNVIIID